MMNQTVTKKEFIELLKHNPLKLPVFWDEVIGNPKEVIVVYWIDSKYLYADNTLHMISEEQLQISIFMNKDSKRKKQLIKWFFKNFNIQFRERIDGEEYQLVGDILVSFKE